MEMDYEYELIEKNLGKNSELINKAFHKIMNDPIKNDCNNINFNTKNNKIENNKVMSDNESEEDLVGPSVPNFLKSTMNLINKNDSDSDDKNKTKNTLDSLLKITPQQNNQRKVINLSKNNPQLFDKNHKTDACNQASYDRLIMEERSRQKIIQDELDEYENKYRNTSLLEQHQSQKKKDKFKNSSNRNDQMMQPFDKEKVMNIGVIDSKRALNIMQENSGLKGRFVQKDKYIGY